MKRSNWPKRDDEDDDDGEPAAEGSDGRSSGVRARGARPPLDQQPCASFEEVHARFKHAVRRCIVRRLRNDPSGAEDIRQEVFIRLDRRIRVNKSVPHPVWPVLSGLIEDGVRNHVRGARRRRIDGEPDEETPTSKPNPEQLLHRDAARAELKREVETIFAAINEGDAELIKLAHVRGLLHSDIAEIVGKGVGAVTVALHRARARFRELYEQHQASRRKP